jgi:hypothetical protein
MPGGGHGFKQDGYGGVYRGGQAGSGGTRKEAAAGRALES